jgi:hypothetical protein
MTARLGDSVLRANRWGASNRTFPRRLINMQQFFFRTYDEPDIASFTFYDTPVQIGYTPRFASSLLLVEAAIAIRVIGGRGMVAGFRRDGNLMAGNANVSGTVLDFFYKDRQNFNYHNDMRIHIVTPANTTNSTVFTAFIYPWDGVGEFFGGLGSNYIRVWEFQN